SDTKFRPSLRFRTAHCKTSRTPFASVPPDKTAPHPARVCKNNRTILCVLTRYFWCAIHVLYTSVIFLIRLMNWTESLPLACFRFLSRPAPSRIRQPDYVAKNCAGEEKYSRKRRMLAICKCGDGRQYEYW